MKNHQKQLKGQNEAFTAGILIVFTSQTPLEIQFYMNHPRIAFLEEKLLFLKFRSGEFRKIFKRTKQTDQVEEDHLPIQVPAAVVTAERHLQPLHVRREEKVEEVEDGLAVVAVHPGGQTLRQEEGGRVLQETGPHTGRQLLQEERPQLAPEVEIKLKTYTWNLDRQQLTYNV